MQSAIRSIFRSPVLKSCAAARVNGISTRTFSQLSKTLQAPLMTKVGTHGPLCQCGCRIKFIHTKGMCKFWKNEWYDYYRLT